MAVEIKYPRRPIHHHCLFVKTNRVPLRWLTRPIDHVFVGDNGWVTLVCKWSSDRDKIAEELFDILG